MRPGDPSDLVDAVTRLRDDPDLARRLGEGGRRLAERRFDRDRLAADVLAVLKRAAAGG